MTLRVLVIFLWAWSQLHPLSNGIPSLCVPVSLSIALSLIFSLSLSTSLFPSCYQCSLDSCSHCPEAEAMIEHHMLPKTENKILSITQYQHIHRRRVPASRDRLQKRKKKDCESQRNKNTAVRLNLPEEISTHTHKKPHQRRCLSCTWTMGTTLICQTC